MIKYFKKNEKHVQELIVCNPHQRIKGIINNLGEGINYEF
jgi:hypothetical protein